MTDYTALFILASFLCGAGVTLLGGWFGAKLVLRLLRDNNPVLLDVVSHAEIPDETGEIVE